MPSLVTSEAMDVPMATPISTTIGIARSQGMPAIGDQIDEHHAEQGDDRADRQLDAARDDDEGLRQREQAEQPDQICGVATG